MPNNSFFKKRFNIISSIVLIVSITGIFLFALAEVKKSIDKQISDSLQTIVRTTEESLEQWLNNRQQNLEKLTHTEWLVEHTKTLLKCPPTPNTLLACTSTQMLREKIKPTLDANQDRGFFIISKDFVSLASMRDKNTGTINPICLNHPLLIEKVFKGEVVLIPPIRS
jgi:hypothetical protein